MNRTAEHDSPLTVTIERQSAARNTDSIYEAAMKLGEVFAITEPLLSFSQIGDRTEPFERRLVHELLHTFENTESEQSDAIGPALRNLLGQLLAMTGDLLPATKCFLRTVDDLTEDEDQRVVLLNLLITSLELRDFDTASTAVDRLSDLRPPMPLLPAECAAPPPSRLPKLHVQTGPLRGLQYDIRPGETVIGRGDTSLPGHNSTLGIEIESLMVSRRHACIRDDGDEWIVEDLGSRGGTFINERPLDGPTPLSDGDCLRLADVELWFKLPGALPAASMPDQIIERCDQCGAVIRPDSLNELNNLGLCAVCREKEFRERDTDTQPPGDPSTGDPSTHDTVQPPPYLDENVQFTVYRPRSMMPLKWYPLLAFAHLSDKPPEADIDEPDPVEEVQRQATAVLGERKEEYRETTQDALHAVPREGVLTMLPEMDGVKFNPPRRTFEWNETVHREEFRMQADAELVGKTARGRLTIFLGSIILAEVPLSIRITANEESPVQRNLESESARPYRKIFASYSHQDLAVVEQFESYVEMLGDEYLRDWKHLRSGQFWNDRLMEMIHEADVFQLFWSQNSMRSKFVRQEWEYALSLNRPYFVRPTYWEEPFPSAPDDNLPPEDLSRLHFQRLSVAALSEVAAPQHKPKPQPPSSASAPVDRGELHDCLLAKLQENVDFSKLAELDDPQARHELRVVVEHSIDLEAPLLSRNEREQVIESCLNECLGPPTDPQPLEAISERDQLKRRVQGQLFGNMDLTGVANMTQPELRREFRQMAAHIINKEDGTLDVAERDRLIDDLLDETFGEELLDESGELARRADPPVVAPTMEDTADPSATKSTPVPPRTAVNIPAGDYSTLGMLQKGLIAAGVVIVGLLAVIIWLLVSR